MSAHFYLYCLRKRLSQPAESFEIKVQVITNQKRSNHLKNSHVFTWSWKPTLCIKPLQGQIDLPLSLILLCWRHSLNITLIPWLPVTDLDWLWLRLIYKFAFVWVLNDAKSDPGLVCHFLWQGFTSTPVTQVYKSKAQVLGVVITFRYVAHLDFLETQINSKVKVAVILCTFLIICMFYIYNVIY